MARMDEAAPYYQILRFIDAFSFFLFSRVSALATQRTKDILLLDIGHLHSKIA